MHIKTKTCNKPQQTSIMAPMALTWRWKSKWKSSSCSHFATQVDIWFFSCSTYSSRGVMKFHFRTCGDKHWLKSAKEQQTLWQAPIEHKADLQTLFLLYPLLLSIRDDDEDRTRFVIFIFNSGLGWGFFPTQDLQIVKCDYIFREVAVNARICGRGWPGVKSNFRI